MVRLKDGQMWYSIAFRCTGDTTVSATVLMKLVMVVTCFILMAPSVEYNDFEQINGWTTAVSTCTTLSTRFIL